MSDQEATVQQPRLQPKIAGELSPEEMQALARLRQQSDQAVQQIGRLELQKIRTSRHLDTLENQAQGVLQAAGKRLGIPDGQPWSTTPDGKAILVTPQGQPVMVPVEDEPEPKGEQEPPAPLAAVPDPEPEADENPEVPVPAEDEAGTTEG